MPILTCPKINNPSILSWLESHQDEFFIEFIENESPQHPSKRTKFEKESSHLEDSNLPPFKLPTVKIEGCACSEPTALDTFKLSSDDGCCDELWKQFSTEGYVLLKGLVDKELILKAKSNIERILMNNGKLSLANPPCAKTASGWTVNAVSGQIISAQEQFVGNYDEKTKKEWIEIGELEEYKQIVHHAEVARVLNLLAKGKANAESHGHSAHLFFPEHCWLRLKSPMENTHEHADIFFFKNHTRLFDHGSVLYEDSLLCGLCNEPCNVDIVEAETEILFDDQQNAENETRRSPCKVFVGYAPLQGTIQCKECGRNFHSSCASSDAIDAKAASQLSDSSNNSGSSNSSNDDSFSANARSILNRSTFNVGSDGYWYCRDCQPRPVLGTCWIPLGDLEVSNGVVAVLPKSHNISGFDREGLTELPMNYRKNSTGLEWRIGPYQAGDVLFFDSKTIHRASVNMGSSYRLSTDLRWFIAPERSNFASSLQGIYVHSETLPL